MYLVSENSSLESADPGLDVVDVGRNGVCMFFNVIYTSTV